MEALLSWGERSEVIVQEYQTKINSVTVRLCILEALFVLALECWSFYSCAKLCSEILFTYGIQILPFQLLPDRTSWLKLQRFWLAFERCSARVFDCFMFSCSFCRLQESAVMVPQTIPLSLHSTLCQIYYSVVIIRSYVILGKWPTWLLPTCTRHGHQHRVTVTRGCIDTNCLSWWWARCARNM